MVWSLVWTWPLAGVGVARSWYEEAGVPGVGVASS